MKPVRPRAHSNSRTRCQTVREWVTLGLGTSAGIAFIYQCTRDPVPFTNCGLLLFLCLTLLGHITVLDRLITVLQTWKPSQSHDASSTDSPAHPLRLIPDSQRLSVMQPRCAPRAHRGKQHPKTSSPEGGFVEPRVRLTEPRCGSPTLPRHPRRG